MFKSQVNTELYDVMGLKPNASEDEIKKTYRKLAIFPTNKNKYHLDDILHGDQMELNPRSIQFEIDSYCDFPTHLLI